MDFEALLKEFALPVLAMGGIVMVALGFIKIFTKMIVNKKGQEESKFSKVMSYFYVIFAMGLSVGVAFGYNEIYHLEMELTAIFEQAISIFACSQALYPIYRDYGGRFLLTKFLSIFKGKSKKADEVIQIIEKFMVLTDSQKEVLTDGLKKDL